MGAFVFFLYFLSSLLVRPLDATGSVELPFMEGFFLPREEEEEEEEEGARAVDDGLWFITGGLFSIVLSLFSTFSLEEPFLGGLL